MNILAFKILLFLLVLYELLLTNTGVKIIVHDSVITSFRGFFYFSGRLKSITAQRRKGYVMGNVVLTGVLTR